MKLHQNQLLDLSLVYMKRISVLEVCSDTKDVKLTFLYPHGPSSSFKYPEPQHIYTIPMDDILTLIDPRTRSGCVYYDKKEMTFATKQHQ